MISRENDGVACRNAGIGKPLTAVVNYDLGKTQATPETFDPATVAGSMVTLKKKGQSQCCCGYVYEYEFGYDHTLVRYLRNLCLPSRRNRASWH